MAAESDGGNASAPSTTPTSARTGASLTARFAGLRTGAKLVLILSAALLPLALIAVFATLRITHLADIDARARLRVAANESARTIAGELVGDMTALRVAVDALGNDYGDAPSCARAQGVFAQRSSSGARFVIADRGGRVLCGDPIPNASPVRLDASPVAADLLPGQGLVLAVSGPGRRISARAYFPESFLRKLGHPTERADAIETALILDDQLLPFETIEGRGALDRMETMRTDLGIAGLSLRTSMRSAPISSSLILAMLLPILMWVLAVGIGWFVVDRLLIAPLRQLRASVAAYRPGEEIDTLDLRAVPAQEIRELGESFRAINDTVARHEAGLEAGLQRQTKLTREVHHRVKNNLQVISSLINFHARGAQSPDAATAYASIQRRVDALAVVHRNHFAEMEENRGLNLRTMIGELAANIRATAPDRNSALGITLDIDAFLVNQDVAVAVAFLVTETVELAMNCDPTTQVRISAKPGDDPKRAVVRIVTRALVESETLRTLVSTRYGRVMEGLSRQLRSPLHHDPLVGAYEISVAVVGKD